jgi:hypothetical protein
MEAIIPISVLNLNDEALSHIHGKFDYIEPVTAKPIV